MLLKYKNLQMTTFYLKNTISEQWHNKFCLHSYDILIWIHAISAFNKRAVVVVWLLDLQLHAQTVPIATKVVSSNPIHGKMYSIKHYVINLSVTCGRSVVFSGYSGIFHQWIRLPRYSWNIVESGAKHHNPFEYM